MNTANVTTVLALIAELRSKKVEIFKQFDNSFCGDGIVPCTLGTEWSLIQFATVFDANIIELRKRYYATFHPKLNFDAINAICAGLGILTLTDLSISADV